MRTPFAIAIMLALAGAPAALAQGSGGAGSPGGATATPQAAPSSRSAPVGHRQPTASDVRGVPDPAKESSPEDKALDRKIKSICKGC